MNAIGELLQSGDIYLDLDVPDKAALLERVALLLSARVRMSPEEIASGLRAREQLGSTALGHGVAFPHARLARCNLAAGLYVRTKMLIAFDAPDRMPVSHVLALVVPRQATERHLRVLATAAAMFGDPKFRNQLAMCREPAAVHELFASWPSTTDAARSPVPAPTPTDTGQPR